jgi:hypothetical protein
VAWIGGEGGGTEARAVERRRARWLEAEASAAARVRAEEKKYTRACGRGQGPGRTILPYRGLCIVQNRPKCHLDNNLAIA